MQLGQLGNLTKYMHKLGDNGVSVRPLYAAYPLWVLPRLLKSSYFGWLYDYYDGDGDDDDDDDDDEGTFLKILLESAKKTVIRLFV